jgi:hypothetical protein
MFYELEVDIRYLWCRHCRAQHAILWTSILNNTYTFINIVGTWYQGLGPRYYDWRFVNIKEFLATTLSKLVTLMSKLLPSVSTSTSISARGQGGKVPDERARVGSASASAAQAGPGAAADCRRHWHAGRGDWQLAGTSRPAGNRLGSSGLSGLTSWWWIQVHDHGGPGVTVAWAGVGPASHGPARGEPQCTAKESRSGKQRRTIMDRMSEY